MGKNTKIKDTNINSEDVKVGGVINMDGYFQNVTDSLNHSTDSVLNVNSDIDNVQKLVSDDDYNFMFRKTYEDDTLTTPQKNDEALKILDHKQKSKKAAAEQVKDMQNNRTENFLKIIRAHAKWGVVVLGAPLTVAALSQTKEGREVLKNFSSAAPQLISAIGPRLLTS